MKYLLKLAVCVITICGTANAMQEEENQLPSDTICGTANTTGLPPPPAAPAPVAEQQPAVKAQDVNNPVVTVQQQNAIANLRPVQQPRPVVTEQQLQNARTNLRPVPQPQIQNAANARNLLYDVPWIDLFDHGYSDFEIDSSEYESSPDDNVPW